jgi:hypothetical protein
MRLTPFAIKPPTTASAHTLAMIANGALLIPASVLRFQATPGNPILCPGCANEFDLEPVWNADGRSANGYTCSACFLVFDNSQALHLVFGHLRK